MHNGRKKLANYCLSASINLNSPNKRCTRALAKRVEIGLNWHTLLIKEVNMQPLAPAVALFLCVRVSEGGSVSSAVDINVYSSFILTENWT